MKDILPLISPKPLCVRRFTCIHLQCEHSQKTAAYPLQKQKKTPRDHDDKHAAAKKKGERGKRGEKTWRMAWERELSRFASVDAVDLASWPTAMAAIRSAADEILC